MDEQDKTYEGIELLKALDLPIDGESSEKPVLLLALIDGISENVFLENEFELSEWLDSHYLMLMRKYTQKAAEGLGILAAILLAA